MAVVQTILWFIPALFILVFVHELGHFLAARAFGMRVDRFSIGFPPNIFKYRRRETSYVIGLTPLGGYVKIAGMIDESLDTEFEKAEPGPDEFRAKPLWQRMVVICAGVVFNMILAAVVFAVMTAVSGQQFPAVTADGSVFVADSSVAAVDVGMRTGDRLLEVSGRPFDPERAEDQILPLLADDLTFLVDRDGDTLTLPGPDSIMTRIQELPAGGLYGIGLYNWPAEIGAVTPGSPADSVGLRVGDQVTTVNGFGIHFWPEMTERIQASGGNAVQLTWVRPGDGAEYAASIVPELNEQQGVHMIGIALPQRTVTYGPARAVLAGMEDTWTHTRVIVSSLSRIVAGRESVRESLGGPIMVAQVVGEAARAGQRPFWTIVAVLSITLAIVNILPIPALDGGHMVFLIYEGIAGREPSLKVRTVMQQAGMALLLVLMCFLIFNDIARWAA